MSLEDLLVITIGIFLVIAYLVMKWCERNTYVLGVGWAIKRKVYLWHQNKKKSRLRCARPEDGKCKSMQCYRSTEMEKNQ